MRLASSVWRIMFDPIGPFKEAKESSKEIDCPGSGSAMGKVRHDSLYSSLAPQMAKSAAFHDNCSRPGGMALYGLDFWRLYFVCNALDSVGNENELPYRQIDPWRESEGIRVRSRPIPKRNPFC